MILVGTFDDGNSMPGALLTADNGLTVSPASNVQLGGTLIKNTNVLTNGHNLVLGDNNVFVSIESGVKLIDASVIGAGGIQQSQLLLSATSLSNQIIDTLGNIQQILLEPASGIIVTDAIDGIGMQYAADYSAADVNPRHIPDIASVGILVDASSFYTADGTLSGDRTVTLGGHDLTFFGTATGLELNDPGTEVLITAFVLATGRAIVTLDPANYKCQIINPATNDMTFEMSLIAWTLTDNINSKGMVYAADYSAAGITDPRWIPDYAAVTALVDSTTGNIGSVKAPGVAASGAQLTVATGGADAMFRVNVAVVFRSGIGTAGYTISYTDTSNTAQTFTSTPLSAVGAGFNNSVNLLAKAGTSIVVSSVITGTAIGDYAATVERLV